VPEKNERAGKGEGIRPAQASHQSPHGLMIAHFSVRQNLRRMAQLSTRPA
jgi:hypothetical protein